MNPNNKKNIILYIPDFNSGGAERQMCGLAVQLKKSGHRVKVIYYNNLTFYKWILDNANVECEYHPELKHKLFRYFRFANLLKLYKPDVVIAYLDSCTGTACRAKILGNGKYKLIVGERNTNQKLSLKNRIKFLLYRVSDCIVANSYSQTKWIHKHMPNLSEKVVTITNFVDMDYFKPTNNKTQTQTLKFITTARYASQKNYLIFLEAINLVKQNGINIHFDCYGNKNHKYYSKVEKKLKELNLEDYVTLHGPEKDILPIYQNADVFILPSIYEGFPNVVCEAMCCGLPVLASNVCDNPIIVDNGISGLLFDPLDVHDIANKIISIASLSNTDYYAAQ